MKKFFLAFVFAWRGIKSSFIERNIKLHFIATILVILFGLYYKISKLEWFVIIILIGLIISLEMMNKSIEDLANVVRDRLNLEYTATTKLRNVAAGAVLISSICAFVIGLIIFLPKII